MPASRPKADDDEVYDASELLDEIKAASRPFKMPNGERFDLPAPTAWPDEALVAAYQGDPVRVAQVILGEANYIRFQAAGGNALVLERLVEKIHGATVGESLASSGS